MPRTTLDIEQPVLDELRKLQREQGGTLGEIVSNLLARVLKSTKSVKQRPLQWKSQRMDAKVDLADREAIYAILDRDLGNP